ncbi:MAG TPA: hypothetical protein VMX95_07975 [Thermodesulfobacteriota bacterium]|jgi:hypothetical protein|nr:hypothetical protein [Thermodesulfobacteriota bacterium]
MKKYLPLKTFLLLVFIFILPFPFYTPHSFASEEPYIKEYSNSGCLGNSPGDFLSDAEEYPGCEAEGISARVEGNSIYVTHFNAVYNCCPDDIAVTLTVRGNRLVLTEKELLTTPCRCLCCYNVETEIAGVKPGKYIIFLCWDDYETYKKLCRRLKVLVP